MITNYLTTTGRKMVKRRLFDGDFHCENSQVKRSEIRPNSENRRQKYLGCKHSQSVLNNCRNEWRQQTVEAIASEDSRFGWWNGWLAEDGLGLLSDVDCSPSSESPERKLFSNWKEFKKYHTEQQKHQPFSNFGGYCASFYGPSGAENHRRHRRKSPNILRIQPAHQFFSQQKEINIRFGDHIVPEDQGKASQKDNGTISEKEDPVRVVLSTDSEENSTLWNDLTLDVQNLDWLLNFRVQDIVERLDFDEVIIGRDHNYETTGKVFRTELCTETSSDSNAKPPFTYPELIELSLQSQGSLTVSGIYNWIMETFPFYKLPDDRWKNAIRHNLSINPQFRKGKKQEGGSHLWKMATEQEMQLAETTAGCYPYPDRFHWKKRKLDELERNYPQLFDKQLPTTIACNYAEENEDIRMLASVDAESPSHQRSLSASADRILFGEPEHRVQVEYMPFVNDRISVTSDAPSGATRMQVVRNQSLSGSYQDAAFLNPISSHDVVEECGLLTDPMSTQRVLSLPRMQCANDLETGSDLFDYELLRILSGSPIYH